jgi:hypothetical protein
MSKLHKPFGSLYVLIVLLRSNQLLSFLFLFIQVDSVMLTWQLFAFVFLERLFWNLVLSWLPIVWRPAIISHPFLNAAHDRQRLLQIIIF